MEFDGWWVTENSSLQQVRFRSSMKVKRQGRVGRLGRSAARFQTELLRMGS
jgi:hypothetical protein